MFVSIGFWPAVLDIVGKTVLSIGLWGVAVIGWIGRPLGWPVRGSR